MSKVHSLTNLEKPEEAITVRNEHPTPYFDKEPDRLQKGISIMSRNHFEQINRRISHENVTGAMPSG